MKHKVTAIVLLLVLMISTMGTYAATDYTSEADKLYALGLFKGTNTGYELSRAPNRAEAAAMLLKLLGVEEAAKAENNSHPFTDVPAWASPFVGYMYKHGMTTGIGNNKFGAANMTQANEYATFVLKALGYTNADFNWLESLKFASDQGIITATDAGSLSTQTFNRNEMVHLSYVALQAKLSGTEQTLLESLKAKGVIPTTPLVPPTQGTTSPAEVSLKKQETVSNIKMGEKLEVNGKYFYILALKEEFTTSMFYDPAKGHSETRELVYKGGIRLKANMTEWDGQNLLYSFNFYSAGKLVKTMEFLSVSYRPVYGDGTDFMTPLEPFDEIRLTVEPISDARLRTDVMDKVEYIPTNDAQKVVDEIFRNTSRFAASSMDLDYVVLDSDKMKSALIWSIGNGGATTYPDGRIFGKHSSGFVITKTYNDVVYELLPDGSSAGDHDGALYLGLPISRMDSSIYPIFLYAENSKVPYKIYVIY